MYIDNTVYQEGLAIIVMLKNPDTSIIIIFHMQKQYAKYTKNEFS